MDNLNLQSFLKLGYFLNYKNSRDLFDFSGINKEKYALCNEDELISIGSNIIIDAITSRFDGSKQHVVPISGGLDSRAILAGLLECTEAKNINTYTFGTPGTLDYDIGNYIAKKLGTNHTKFSLTEYQYTMNELINVSKRVDYQTILFHHGPVQLINNHFNNCLIWSGFMGDTLAGSHLDKCIYNYKDLKTAKRDFINKNKYVKKIDLTNCEDEDLYDAIDFPYIDAEKITYQEQLDFMNRQLKFIAPHVLMKGFSYEIPFLDEEWFNFILSVDNVYRYNQNLYRSILLNVFPKAFSFVTKANYGLPLNANKVSRLIQRLKNKVVGKVVTNKYVNYIDFDEGIRNRHDLKTIVYENIMDLQRRKIVEWIDIDKIWRAHLNKKANYADALIVLTSLEIHYKSKELERV